MRSSRLTALALGSRASCSAFATLVKGYPISIAPALLGQEKRRFAIGLASTLLLYVPYFGEGSGVLGYFPTYLREERIDTGDRLLRLARVVFDAPMWAFVVIALATYLAVALRIVRRSANPSQGPALFASALATIVVALGTPHYAWYYVWLIALACLAPRPVTLWVACSGALLDYEPHTNGGRLVFESLMYAPTLVLLALEWRKLRVSSRDSRRTLR